MELQRRTFFASRNRVRSQNLDRSTKMSQTPVNSLRQGEVPMPIDLAVVGLDESVNILRNSRFLWVLADLENLPESLPSALPLEQQEADRYPDERRREGYVARRRITRGLLAPLLGGKPDRIRIEAGLYGAPVVSEGGAGFHLSFSAREDWALIGIARMPIGVDLEIMRPGLALPWNVLRAEERSALERLPELQREAAFLRLWSAKEAVAKLLGLGFRIAPEQLSVAGFLASAPSRLHVAGHTGAGDRLPPVNVQIHQMGLKLRNKMLEADLTGGLVVAAASIA